MAYYFASDTHFGLSGPEHSSEKREKLFVKWLDSIKSDADSIYLVGDIFDFWFEYKRVVPKGFVRVLGKLAELADAGIDIHFLIGNHDIWTYGYLEKELGIKVHRTPQIETIYGKRLFIAHGDRFCKVKKSDKIVLDAFHNKTLYNIFSRIIHPDLFMKMGSSWSHNNRYGKAIAHKFMGDDESLVKSMRELTSGWGIDYYVFGHLHVPVIHPIDDAKMVILGEWIENPVYGVLTEEGFRLEEFH